MNNTVSNQQNQRFSEVREELKRVLSIIMYSIENEPENGFDSIIANSNNPEDIKIAEYLKQDDLNREKRISIEEKTKKAKEQLNNKHIVVGKPRVKSLTNEQIIKVEKITNRNINKEHELDDR